MKGKIIIIILSALLLLSLAVNIIMVYRELTRWDTILDDYIAQFVDTTESTQEDAPQTEDAPGAEETLQAEDIAPDFSVQLLTGETFTLSDHRDSVVVLDFWATWCRACVDKMPAMQTLSEQFEDDVIFVGMNVGEDQQRVQDFIAERGFTYPIGLDDNGDIHRNLFPSPGIPFMVIINGDGVITARFLGSGLGFEQAAAEAIVDAIG